MINLQNIVAPIQAMTLVILSFTIIQAETGEKRSKYVELTATERQFVVIVGYSYC